MIETHSLVLGLQIGEVGLEVGGAASRRSVNGAEDELASAIRSHQNPQGLQPAVGVRLSGDLEGRGADAVPGGQRDPAVASAVRSVGTEEAVAGQYQESARCRWSEPGFVETH